MCFGVAIGAFLTAALGFVVNQYLVGWLATGGMVAIGLLYIGMGLLQIRLIMPKDPADHIAYLYHKDSRKSDVRASELESKSWDFPSDFESEDSSSTNAVVNSR